MPGTVGQQAALFRLVDPAIPAESKDSNSSERETNVFRLISSQYVMYEKMERQLEELIHVLHQAKLHRSGVIMHRTPGGFDGSASGRARVTNKGRGATEAVIRQEARACKAHREASGAWDGGKGRRGF